MLNIAAFTFTYDHVEDRILLIGNFSNGQQRIDLWLTRKLVLRLLNAAPELVSLTSGVVSEAAVNHKLQIAQFHHDQAQHQASVQAEKQHVIAQSGSLLTRLDISHQSGRYRLMFFANTDQAVAMSILSYEELHQILHLMHKGAQELDWGVAAHLFDHSPSSTTVQ